MIIDGLIIQPREKKNTYLKFVMQNVLVSYPGTISLKTKIKVKIFTLEEKGKEEEEMEN